MISAEQGNHKNNFNFLIKQKKNRTPVNLSSQSFSFFFCMVLTIQHVCLHKRHVTNENKANQEFVNDGRRHTQKKHKHTLHWS